MAATPAERVQAHRVKLRAAGLRPVQVWVPDTGRPGFAEECARQSELVRKSGNESDALDFIEHALDTDDWE